MATKLTTKAITSNPNKGIVENTPVNIAKSNENGTFKDVSIPQITKETIRINKNCVLK